MHSELLAQQQIRIGDADLMGWVDREFFDEMIDSLAMHAWGGSGGDGRR